MDRRCTYEGCTESAAHRETPDGAIDLCQPHHDKWEAVTNGGNVGALMGFWVRAQGGAKKAANRMTGGGL